MIDLGSDGSNGHFVSKCHGFSKLFILEFPKTTGFLGFAPLPDSFSDLGFYYATFFKSIYLIITCNR